MLHTFDHINISVGMLRVYQGLQLLLLVIINYQILQL